MAQCMTPELWKRVETVFEMALGMDAAERRSFIERECNGDAALIAEIEALLALDYTQSNTIECIVGEAAGTMADKVTAIQGSMIGCYRVIRLIGEGGMGTVFEVVLGDDFMGPHYALKLVQPGTLTESARQRFINERLILGSLNHASIVRLVAYGEYRQCEDEPSVPYMVMELIEGENIRVYCDRLRLGVQARLELFLKVLEAVKFTHRNMVVHRDLKPANILVSENGNPHLLDFGIARVLRERRTSERAVPMMTPAYASPEQLNGKPVTTLDDVYSLGLVLFELMTGIRARSTKSGSTAEIYRAACETPIPLPSEAAPDRAWLCGEIDHIVSKSIQKDPEERYHSVESFAAAVRAFLAATPTMTPLYPQQLNHNSARASRV